MGKVILLEPYRKSKEEILNYCDWDLIIETVEKSKENKPVLIDIDKSIIPVLEDKVDMLKRALGLANI